ncbi:MAG: hypothetical protein AYK18_14135 [Theionarchaea archaeon DG-70]|nr:MAG: hypothetical protein AYK18_14135 [Theionarchaea archaeon DG-70]
MFVTHTILDFLQNTITEKSLKSGQFKLCYGSILIEGATQKKEKKWKYHSARVSAYARLHSLRI